MAYLDTICYERRILELRTNELVQVHDGIVVLSVAHLVTDEGVYDHTVIPTYTVGDRFVNTSDWNNYGKRVMVLPETSYAMQAVERAKRNDS